MHSVNQEEIDDVAQFIERALPADESCLIPLKNPSEMSVKELKAAIHDAGLARQTQGFTEKSDFVKLLKDHYDSVMHK